MPYIDTTDPAKQYTAEYLIDAATSRVKTRKAKEEEDLPLPTADQSLLADTRNLLSRMSNAYAKAMGQEPTYPSTLQATLDRENAPPPVNDTTLMYSPNPNMARNVPIVGKDITLDTLKEIIGAKESGGSYTAYNKAGYYGGKASRASGKYQYTPSTWNGYGGYAEAAFAPPAVQEAKMNEDLTRRLQRYHGDIFKVVAEHYLPVQANRPELWTKPSYVGKTKVMPVADYLTYVFKGTPLEAQLNAYLGREQVKPRASSTTR